MIKIIVPPSPNRKYIVFYKPKGLATAPLNALETENALCELAASYPDVMLPLGKKSCEGGLLHRLDTATAGLVLCATTQESYDKLYALQKAGKILKTYKALCQKNTPPLFFPPCPFAFNTLQVSSYFRGYGKHSRLVCPLTEASHKKRATSRLYTTKIIDRVPLDSRVLITVQLNIGYRHQVRVHLAWLGMPIANDLLYDTKASPNATMQFYANSISFPSLETGEIVTYTLPETLQEFN